MGSRGGGEKGGREGEAEKERGSRQGRSGIGVRNIVGVTEEQSKEDTSVIVSLLVRWYEHATETNLILTTNTALLSVTFSLSPSPSITPWHQGSPFTGWEVIFSIIHTDISCSGSIMYLIIPLSVADAAAISYSHIQRVPWFHLHDDRQGYGPGSDGEKGEKKLHMNSSLRSSCSPVSFSDETLSMFLLVTSLLQAGTHTLLALLLMHRQPNLSSQTNTHTLGSEFLQAFIYPTLRLLIRRSSFLWLPEPINSHLRHQDRAIIVIIAWMTGH